MATYRIKVSVKDTEPLVWRRIEVPDRITFHQLHLVLQECFQWRGCHLYRFDVPELGTVERYWEDDDWADEDEVPPVGSLETLIDPYMKPGVRFAYVYDFGDCWEHIVDVEAVDKRGGRRMPVVTAWEGQSLIEDAGGIGGYAETLRILGDKDDPEYRTTREWVRTFAPPRFDPEDINGHMAEHLYFPKAAFNEVKSPLKEVAEDSQVAVDLKEAVEYLDMQTEGSYAYVDLDTGECRIFFSDAGLFGQDVVDECEEELETCRPLFLLRPDELEDYRVMRDFAWSREGAAGDRLSKAIEGRGAFKRFRNAVHQLGLAKEWYAYRDDYRAELLKSLFEANGVRWKKASIG